MFAIKTIVLNKSWQWQLDKIPKVLTESIGILKKIFSTPVPIATLMLGLLMKSTGTVPKSMGTLPVLDSTLQSIKRGKSTEIDYLNGEIVALGKKLGILTPYNSIIVNMVHQVEATGEFLSVGELLSGLEKIVPN